MTGKIEAQLQELDSEIEAFVTDTRAQFDQFVQERLASLETRLEAAELAAAQRGPLSSTTPRSPAIRAPQKPSLASLELPDPLTWRSLDTFLRDRGFGVIDNRSSYGAYWVLDDGQRFESVRNLLRAKGVSCQFYAARKRYKGPSYQVDTGKAIPE